MIYLDVTGGCVPPLQSGIPRTTRAVHQLFKTRVPDTMPVRWQPFRLTYTRLSRKATALLEDKPSPAGRRGRPPRDTTFPLLVAALRDVAAWPPAVPLGRVMKDTDVLLLTSIFPDNRLRYLERLLTRPGRKMAIFHDAIPLRDSNVPAWERQHHLRALQLFSRLDQVIAVSKSARDDLLELFREQKLSPPPVTVVAWPVPFQRGRPDFTPPSPEGRVLYVSRLKQTKNHATLLAAAEQLWSEGIQFSLSLIGCEDEPRESASIVREVQRLKAAGRPICWRAQVSEEELHQAYRSCSFTVFPSHNEGFGLPIVESFWHGRGVICSQYAAMAEVSAGPGAVQLDVSRSTLLASAMRHFLTDPAACHALARAAYDRPQRTWDDYWRELEVCLELEAA